MTRPRSTVSRLALVALGAALVAGCDFQDREPAVPDGSVVVSLVGDGGALFGSDANARRGGGAPVYGCYAATPTETGGHDLSRARLHFPDAVVARADGRRRIVMFMTDKRLGAERREPGLAQTVRCVIPDDDEAAELAKAALGASGEPLWPVEAAENARSRSCETVVVAVIYVQDCTVSGGFVSCGPWRVESVVTEERCSSGGGGGGTWSGSDPCDSSQLMPPADQDGLGCELPGGGGGQPPGAPKTCDTDNPVVNAVSDGFDSLWLDSNPYGALEDRQETAAWIVDDGLGNLSLIRATRDPNQSSHPACGFIPAPGSRPPGTVGFVHTHPYGPGISMGLCSRTDPFTGDTYTPISVDGPSDSDKAFMRKERLYNNIILDPDGTWAYGPAQFGQTYSLEYEKCAH